MLSISVLVKINTSDTTFNIVEKEIYTGLLYAPKAGTLKFEEIDNEYLLISFIIDVNEKNKLSLLSAEDAKSFFDLKENLQVIYFEIEKK